MSNEALFRILTIPAILGWILLLLAPDWKWTHRLAMFTLPMLLAVAYLVIYIMNFEGLHAAFSSFSAAQYAVHSPGLVLLGWTHYLAIDLFVGAWMVRDSRRLRIVHLAVIPCLLLTFLFGPLGLLVYLSIRTGLRRGADARE